MKRINWNESLRNLFLDFLMKNDTFLRNRNFNSSSILSTKQSEKM